MSAAEEYPSSSSSGRQSVVIDLSLFYCQECRQYASCSHLQQCEHVQSIKEEVVRAMTRQGYFLITGHNVSMTLLEQIRQVSQHFFTSSMETKLFACSKDRARRGYSPIATENFATLVGEAGKPNDTVEKFRIGPMHPPDIVEAYPDYFNTKEARIHFFPNDWTHTTIDFHNIAKLYYDAMFELSLILSRIIEFCLSLTAQALVEETDRHTSILCLNYYPSLPIIKKKEQMIERIAEHTDVSMFTIVTELANSSLDEQSCEQDVYLEIFNNLEKQWERVKYDPGMFLVNIGDCLHERSKNQLLSALHRVVMYPNPVEEEVVSKERYSTAFFFSPNYNAKMNWPVEEQLLEEEVQCIDYDTWRKDRVKRAMEKLKKDTAPPPKPPSKKALAKAAKLKAESAVVVNKETEAIAPLSTFITRNV